MSTRFSRASLRLLVLVVALTLSGCGSGPFGPTPTLAPTPSPTPARVFSTQPPSVTLHAADQVQTAKLGSYCWGKPPPEPVVCADAFGLLVPDQNH